MKLMGGDRGYKERVWGYIDGFEVMILFTSSSHSLAWLDITKTILFFTRIGRGFMGNIHSVTA
jgi:hypothetical protein